MRHALVLSLALCAFASVPAAAQSCMGRPEERHVLVHTGGFYTDAFVRRSVGYASRTGRGSGQVTLTDASLWARPLRHRAYTTVISRDIWSRDSAAAPGASSGAASASRPAGNRWCVTTGIRERREPVPTGLILPGGKMQLDQERTYGHARVHAALGWGRTVGLRAGLIQPFAQAGAALDLETLDLPEDDRFESRIAPAGFAQAGVGVGGEAMHATVAVAYLPGLPQYSLLGRHNWLQLTVNVGVRIERLFK